MTTGSRTLHKSDIYQLACPLLLAALCFTVACTTPTPSTSPKTDDAEVDAGSDAEPGQDTEIGHDTAPDDVAMVVCEAGATRCADGARQERCAADGSAWVMEACPQAEVCVESEGRCVARICEPGTRQCAEGGVEVCVGEGAWWQLEPCADGEVCAEETGTCTARRCAPGAPLRCIDDALAEVCNADGSDVLEVPCEAEGLCLDGQCRPPGEVCRTDAGCDGDRYCQEQRCVAWGQGPRGAFDQACRRDGLPQPELDFEVQCAQDLFDVDTQPVVADLDHDGVPEIVFVRGVPSTDRGRLVVLRGDDCSVVASPESPLLAPKAGLAVADMNDDGYVEIVARGVEKHTISFDHEINILWDSPPKPNTPYDTSAMPPAITRIFEDEDVHVAIGGRVLIGEDARVVFDHSSSDNPLGYSMAVRITDLDYDGDRDIILRDMALLTSTDGLSTNRFEHGGFWCNPSTFSGAWPTVLGCTSAPVASNPNNHVYFTLERIDGEIEFGPITLPTSGWAQTQLADFDGDGEIEVAWSGDQTVGVVDLECVGDPLPEDCESEGVRWSQPVQQPPNPSSGSTSSFDFDGDGSAELIHNDACFLHVFDGATGAVRLAWSNPGGRSFNNPIVADVDGDLSAELVVPASLSESRETMQRVECGDDPITGMPYTEHRGLFVLRSPTDRWMPTRPIWHQVAYDVSDVSDDGTIPILDVPGWLDHGTFRHQFAPGLDVLAAPDLTVGQLDVVADDACARGTFVATLHNRGAGPVAGELEVRFYAVDDRRHVLCQQVTRARIEPGGAIDMRCDATLPDGPYTLLAEVGRPPAAGGLAECNGGNNSASVAVEGCR